MLKLLLRRGAETSMDLKREVDMGVNHYIGYFCPGFCYLDLIFLSLALKSPLDRKEMGY